MIVKTKKQQLGNLPPQYHFSLNPYPDRRFSSCPDCGHKTGQRKIPLLIHVQPSHTIALNYTCRYCSDCDKLIGHKEELEHILTSLFLQNDPSVIGNDYYIIGTVEKKAWREGLAKPKSWAEILPQTHDFKTYQEIRMTMGGWFRVGQEPPVMDPPPSAEWVKQLQ
jgi:hypothetical protein